MSVVFYSSFVCVSAYESVYFNTILWDYLRARLPSDFPSTAIPPVFVLAVLGTLAVLIQNKNNKKEPQSISAIVQLLAVWQHTKPKIKNRRVALLLCTTCMRFSCIWIVNCVVA